MMTLDLLSIVVLLAFTISIFVVIYKLRLINKSILLGWVVFSVLLLITIAIAVDSFRDIEKLLILGMAAALLFVGFTVSQQSATLRDTLARMTEREQRLTQAADIAKLGHYYYDTREERIVYCTEQHARNHGKSVEEYMKLASTLGNTMPLIHPEDHDLLRESYTEVLQGKQVALRYRVLVPEGELVVKEITQPVFGDGGDVIGEIGTTMDITEQTETERNLLITQKLETTGRIAAGLAHDLNNILSVILNNLELLRPKLTIDTHNRYIDASLGAIDRGKALVDGLLSFSRQSDLRPQLVNLNDVARDARTWGNQLLSANISVETSLLAGLWPVRIDVGLMENSILNLLLNANDAMADGGRLTIETANLRIDEAYLRKHKETLEPGRYVMLGISDTGKGIEPETMDQIFEPFFTSKEFGQGSGLGLSMVMGFMKQSGGTIRVYSEPGVGTSFKLYFPVAKNGSSDDTPPDPVDSTFEFDNHVVHGARILLAEDEAELREAIGEALVVCGYRVVQAASGDEAFELYSNQGDFDLLVTDVVMPGSLSGPLLARRIREIDAQIPVIFMSGYAAEAMVHGNGLRPDDIRLQKPFRISELFSCVYKALSKSTAGPAGESGKS